MWWSIRLARLPGCAGQASDAVSAFTHGKMAHAPAWLRLPKSDRREKCGYVYHVRNVQKHGKVWKNQCFHWKGICADTVVEQTARNFLPRNAWERALTWECLFVQCEQGLFLSVYNAHRNLFKRFPAFEFAVYSNSNFVVAEIFFFFLNLLCFRNSFTHNATLHVHMCCGICTHMC